MEKIEITKEGDTYIAKDFCTSVVDEGKTVKEALENLKEALQLYCEDMEARENMQMTVLVDNEKKGFSEIQTIKEKRDGFNRILPII